MQTERPELTPGKLYAMLSEAFREARARTCLGCTMPMVFSCDREQGQGANWSVEPMALRCSRCEVEVARIVRKFGTLYDMHNPDAGLQPVSLDPKQFTPL